MAVEPGPREVGRRGLLERADKRMFNQGPPERRRWDYGERAMRVRHPVDDETQRKRASVVQDVVAKEAALRGT